MINYVRKLVLSITAVLGLTLSAYGQVYAGGAIGTSKIGGSKSVNVVPEAGYYINEHNAVSLSLGYSTYIDTDADITTHTLCVMPCYSYAIPLEVEWRDGRKANIDFNWFNTGINFGFYYYVK